MLLRISIYFRFQFVLILNLPSLLAENFTTYPSNIYENLTMVYQVPSKQNSMFLVSNSATLNTSSQLVQNFTTIKSLIEPPAYLQDSKTILRIGVHSERNPEVYCKLQPNGFDCDDSGIFIPRFYYDVKMENCKTFHYGQCGMDLNRFNTLLQCHEACKGPGGRDIYGNFTADIYCRFQPDFGRCNDYYPKWYYDVTTRSCKGFAYSGCGGNLNRFDTNQHCMTVCNEHND